MANKLTGPPSIMDMLSGKGEPSRQNVTFAHNDDVEILSSDAGSVNEEVQPGLRKSEKGKSIYYESDTDEEAEALPVQIGESKNALGLVYEDAENFQTFESLMKIDKETNGKFFRVPFNIPGGKLNYFPIPWNTTSAKIGNLMTRKSNRNLYFKLEGLFFLWTPLITHEKTTVTVAVSDSRGSSGKPTIVNSVKFESQNVTLSGMSVGNCVHLNDLDKVKFAIGLQKRIAGEKVRYATIEVCFYVSVSNRASLETHSVIAPVIVPPEVKNLLKDYKKTAEYLRLSNAKIISRKRLEECDDELESDMNGRRVFIGPSVTAERVKALTHTGSLKPTTQFGTSEVRFTDK